VPTNVEIRLSYFNGQPIGDPSVLVRPVGGQPITLDIRDHEGEESSSVRLVLAKPTEELLANTTYEVLDRVVYGCRPGSAPDSGADCLQPHHAVVATFVTGATKDQAPPSFGGVKVPTIHELLVCDSDGCCGPYSGVPVIFDWDPAADDHSPDLVRYNVYRSPAGTTAPGQPVARFKSDFPFMGELLCSGSRHPGAGPGAIIEPGVYAVRAVDSAGNEEQNTTVVEVPAACASAKPDASSEPDASGGCTISRPRTLHGLSIFALLSGLLLARYARRSRQEQ